MSSILSRYRKPGGFRQLLLLIETSVPAKQETLLKAVEKEDPSWAQLLRDKKITAEMVLSWDVEHLSTITIHMNQRHLATLCKKMDPQIFDQLKQMMDIKKYRELEEIMDNMDEPLGPEYLGACNNLLETVRQLDEDKVIILRFIDPKLDLSEAEAA